MGIIKLLFFTFLSFSLSSLDFLKIDDPSFNKVFLKKQIHWSVKKYMPNLLLNNAFNKELTDFISSESPCLFLPTSKKIKVPKYFFRANIKKSNSYGFEVGFIFNDKIGHIWKENGTLSKKILIPRSKVSLFKTCVLSESSKALYFEFNTESQVCKAYLLNKKPSSPLNNYTITAKSTDGIKTTLIAPHSLFPGIIKHGNPSLHRELKKKWRLGISRIENKFSHSVVYFP